MSSREKAILAIVFSAILGGGNAVFSKLGLKEIPSLLFIFLRFVLSSLILVPFILKEKVKFDKNLVKLVLISFLATINIFLFVFGVKRTSANIATMIYTSTPIIVTILSYLIFKEKINLKKGLGILLGFLGTIYIILLPVLGNKTQMIQGDIVGNIAIFIGAICFSLYAIFSKDFPKHYSPRFVSLIFFLCTIVASLPLAILDIWQKPLWWQISLEGWVGLFYVGIFGAVGLYILFQYAIKYGSPLIASLNSYLQPITGMIWAAAILGEKITLGFVVGALMTITGVWLVTKN